ncbi:uncharacterized protein LOC129273577 [Lytechinus pictus]|uniref:uncharacterized protein LOC129273577 n=1 Tax=Lytechinus pictus TaxID=7653 RepID=UPI0030B9CB44
MKKKSIGTDVHQVVAVLSVVIVLLVIIVVLLVVYIAVLKWKKGRRRRSERDIDQPTSMFHHLPSNCIISNAIMSMTDYQIRKERENTKVNPAYVPEDDEPQNGWELSCGPCGGDSNGHRENEENVTHEQEILTPYSCGSGRIDSELIELLKTDMKESVTVEVDSKLLVFMSREIDDSGGTLVLDKMGISLIIPPCAIPRGKKEIIQLVLDWDLSDFPPMKETQTIISPVVHCGPHGLKLAKPAILSFMHCADDTRDIVVLSSETHLTQDKHWKPIQHRKKCGKVEYALLENQCQVYLSHFSLYTCIAQGSHPKLTKKWIQLAAFGKKEGGQFQVLMYMLNNTPCALQFATQQQAKYNCPMLRCPLEFLIDEEGGDLVFELKHLNDGWSPVGRKFEETGLFPDIWQGKCNNISFTFKHVDPSCNDLNFNICLFQKHMPEVKRHFEVAMSFQMKSSARSRTKRRFAQPTTNLNLNLSPALPSVVINGFDSGISTSASETTSFKSVIMDQYHINGIDIHTDDDKEAQFDMVVSGCCGGDQAFDGSEYSDDDDDDQEDLEKVTPATKEDIVNDGMMAVKTRQRRSRTFPGSNNSTSTTNINIHTGTVVQSSTPLDHHSLPHDDPPPAVFPLRLRSKLMALLDPPCPVTSSVNDWRVLAESLHLDALVSFIRMKPSPTEELLDVAAQKGKDCRWLYGVLRDAERYDAANEVGKYLQDGSESPRRNNEEDPGCIDPRISETRA